MECPPLAAAAAVSIRQRPWTALAWRASQQAEAVHQMLGSEAGAGPAGPGGHGVASIGPEAGVGGSPLNP
jgi:hypothetical protein